MSCRDRASGDGTLTMQREGTRHQACSGALMAGLGAGLQRGQGRKMDNSSRTMWPWPGAREHLLPEDLRGRASRMPPRVSHVARVNNHGH